MKKTLFLLFLLFLYAVNSRASELDSEASLISSLKTERSIGKKIDIYYKLIAVYNEQKNNKKVIETYKNIIELNPKSKILYDVLVSLGKVHELEKQYADAIESFKEAVDLKPKKAEARIALADIYELNDLNSLAKAQYIEVLKRHKRSVDANRGLARLYLKLGFYSKAIYYYKLALKIKPGPEVCSQISFCYERTGDIDSAIAAIREAAAANENYQEMMDLGRLYNLKNMNAYAEEQYLKAVKSDPSKPDAYIYLGILNLNTDNIDKALGFLDNAKRQSPDEVSIHFLLSYAYYLKKNVKMTNEELRLAKEDSKDNPAAQSYVDKFQKLLLEEKIKSDIGNGLYFRR